MTGIMARTASIDKVVDGIDTCGRVSQPARSTSSGRQYGLPILRAHALDAPTPDLNAGILRQNSVVDG